MVILWSLSIPPFQFQIQCPPLTSELNSIGKALKGLSLSLLLFLTFLYPSPSLPLNLSNFNFRFNKFYLDQIKKKPSETQLSLQASGPTLSLSSLYLEIHVRKSPRLVLYSLTLSVFQSQCASRSVNQIQSEAAVRVCPTGLNKSSQESRR